MSDEKRLLSALVLGFTETPWVTEKIVGQIFGITLDDAYDDERGGPQWTFERTATRPDGLAFVTVAPNDAASRAPTGRADLRTLAEVTLEGRDPLAVGRLARRLERGAVRCAVLGYSVVAPVGTAWWRALPRSHVVDLAAVAAAPEIAAQLVYACGSASPDEVAARLAGRFGATFAAGRDARHGTRFLESAAKNLAWVVRPNAIAPTRSFHASRPPDTTLLEATLRTHSLLELGSLAVDIEEAAADLAPELLAWRLAGDLGDDRVLRFLEDVVP